MTQVPLFLGLCMLGLAACLACEPKQRVTLMCVLSFPTGLALAVATELLMLGLSIPCTPVILGGVLVSETAAAVTWAVRKGVARSSHRTLFFFSLGFAALACLLSYRGFALFTYDSHRIVMLAGVLAADHSFAPGVLAELSMWGVFQVIARSLVMFTQESYLYALQPVCAASFLALFGVMLWHSTGVIVPTDRGRRLRIALIAMFTIALFSIHAFAYHFVYIHTNLAASLYTFAFLSLFWLAEVTQEVGTLPIAFVCIFSLAIQRVEAPVFALVCLSLTTLNSSLPRRPIVIGTGLVTCAVSAWYMLLSTEVPEHSAFLTPNRCFQMTAVLLAFLAYLCAATNTALKRINQHFPLLLGALCFATLAFAFGTKTEHMIESLYAWTLNLFTLPQWGWSWYLLLLVTVVTLPLKSPPLRAVWVAGFSIQASVILLLVTGRTPYRFSVDDSANRMTMHIVPLLVFYLALKVIPAQLTRLQGVPPAVSADAPLRAP